MGRLTTLQPKLFSQRPFRPMGIARDRKKHMFHLAFNLPNHLRVEKASFWCDAKDCEVTHRRAQAQNGTSELRR